MRPDRPAPPTRPTLSRPDVELPERPIFDGTFTTGSTPGRIDTRHELSPGQQEILTHISASGAIESDEPIPVMLARLVDAGLVDLVEAEDGIHWGAQVSPQGDEALRRGWYPA